MKHLLFFVIILFPLGLTAQQYEVGLLFGISTYQGDIAPSTNRFDLNDVHPSIGVFGRYNVNRFFTARASFSYGKLSGTDAQANDEGRRQRNLSFQSKFYEFGLTGEINIFGYEAEGLQRRFSPYIFGGVAVFHFNPETNYQGQLVELQPLGTEGQGMEGFSEKYKLTQFAIPMGAGVKFAVSERFNVGLEAGVRKTFTDYIDDVSTDYVNYNQLLRGNGELAAALGNRTGEFLGTEPIDIPTGSQRGNLAVSDWYFIAGVTVSYNIFGNSSGLGRRGKNDFGCPKF
jgi:opacity protein-like surface antigen